MYHTEKAAEDDHFARTVVPKMTLYMHLNKVIKNEQGNQIRTAFATTHSMMIMIVID